MLANQRENRERASKGAQGKERISSNISEKSQGSKYKDKALNYYNSFGGKHQQADEHDPHGDGPMTPQQNKNEGGFLKRLTNFYLKNAKIDENTLKIKSMNYLEKLGLTAHKAAKRYYKDNDLCNHLKADKKQCLCHQMRIGEQQLRVRYPKTMNSLYVEEYEKKRGCVGGKSEVLNRDKEKKTFKADPICMKTTKQMDFTGETVPYERVKNSRPATSYGPFTSSTSYGNTFQGWDVKDSYVPTIVPKGNLQSTTGVAFKAVSAYRDTFRSGSQVRPGTSIPGGDGSKGALGGTQGVNNTAGGALDPNQVFGGKNRNQKSQISIFASPGNNKTPFNSNTTHRTEFCGRSMERSRPIKHADNLGSVNLQVDPKLYNTSYRNEYNEINNFDPCKREEERVTLRRGLKQLQ